MEMLLRRIYAGQKYPHIYMLCISTGKNQSAKIRGALYITTYEYNYNVITGCDTILQEYYITNRDNCESTKRYTIMNNTKSAYVLQKKNLRYEQGAGRMGPQTGQLLIHDATASLSDDQEVHHDSSSKI